MLLVGYGDWKRFVDANTWIDDIIPLCTFLLLINLIDIRSLGFPSIAGYLEFITLFSTAK